MGQPRKFINIEFKARHSDPGKASKYLESKGAQYIGTSDQTDTYFKVSNGRLKIREDPIQNLVIYYERDEDTDAKESKVTFFEYDPKTRIKEILEKTNGILVIVKKTRKTSRIGNVKFNIDEVEGLGNFVEIEVDDLGGKIGKEKLLEQLEEYKKALGIKNEDIVNASYSDMLLKKK